MAFKFYMNLTFWILCSIKMWLTGGADIKNWVVDQPCLLEFLRESMAGSCSAVCIGNYNCYAGFSFLFFNIAISLRLQEGHRIKFPKWAIRK